MFEAFLQMIAPSRCPLCGDYLAVGESCACEGCMAVLSVTADTCERTQLPRVTLYDHGTQVRSAILALKFGGDAWRGLAMGQLFDAVRTQVAEHGFDCVIPVPLHRRRLLTRGYNQAERIARGVSEQFAIPLRTNLLSRVRHDAAQAKASEDDRRARDNPFASRGGRSLRVLLVDDVITTGTTLAQAAEALIAAGHQPAMMLAVARQPRHDDVAAL